MTSVGRSSPITFPRKALVSSGRNCNWATRTSQSWSRARSRASGRAGSTRVAMTKCSLGRVCSTRAVMARCSDSAVIT